MKFVETLRNILSFPIKRNGSGDNNAKNPGNEVCWKYGIRTEKTLNDALASSICSLQ